jgi:hypothetical protein
MPAFDVIGDISLGANKLKFSAGLLKTSTSWANALDLKTASDAARASILLLSVSFGGDIIAESNAQSIRAPNIDDYYLRGRARDTGVGLVEVWRMVGANWAHLLLTRAKFGTTTITPSANTRGGFYVVEGGAGVADKLYWIAKNSLDDYEAVQVAVAS